MEGTTTLVLGASPKEDRYSNKAVRRLSEHGHPVIAVALRPGMIGDHTILTEVPEGVGIHTVTMYLNAANQERWIPVVLGLHPRRIIFNPGAENERLAGLAEREGIEVVEACTLVMLATWQY
ncbi:MAG: CoA-binding protein [Flavobacteriales bacterium]|nr:CoA-binding protein [Flavobacteriales bacterium]